MVFILLPQVGWAKKAFLEWKPIKGAVWYEIKVEKKGKLITQKKQQETSWSNNLNYGIFVYQIRAIDRLNRPGGWTEPQALVIKPTPPELLKPNNKDTIKLYNSKANVLLSWKEVAGTTKYKVEIKQAGKPVQELTTEGTSVDVALPPGGNYSWTVTAVVEAGQRAPASLTNKVWQSDPSETLEFQVGVGKLEAPKLVFPTETHSPPRNKKLNLQWKAVDGAESYQVRIIRKQGRSPAQSKSFDKTFISQDNSLEVQVPGEGYYTWEVAALANFNVKKEPGSIGAKSEEDFELSHHALFAEGSGYIAGSLMVATYKYKVVSPLTGFGGTTKSQAMTFRLSGEYWFKTDFGVAPAMENTAVRILGKSANRGTIEIYAKYRIPLTNSKYGWFLYPKIGLEFREYIELRPDVNANTSSSVGSNFHFEKVEVAGMGIGFDIRKQFTDKFSLGSKASYYLPMGFRNRSQKISAAASFRNMSIGVQGLYWFRKQWAMGMGGYLEQRSIGYYPSQHASAAQEVFMDGAYFFGSIVYSFGK